MGSYNIGKREACEWIRTNIPLDASVLDVGACDGKWRTLLPDYLDMDAVEVYKPNADRIAWMYRKLYNINILDFHYDHYGLVIFGDMLEHMAVKDAQTVLKYAEEHADNILIAIPFHYEQDALYGNQFEVHLQPDLTPELFEERYPGYTVLLRAAEDYCYYIKTAGDVCENNHK